MKWTILMMAILMTALATSDANARSRSVRCREWAHEQVRNEPRPAGGAVRGAALGAVGGAILGNAGVGAAAGAGIGAAHAASRRRSFGYYYDRCMRHWR
ncbi:MAG TPA: hypothetical protein VMU22_12890 [Rhizomicrobium sp.]|nr:hypothetical protein [Rhizomicrobium sp.]